MDRRRKLSTADDDKNDRITSTEYFPAENNLNYSQNESGTINKSKNTEMVPLYNLLSEDMRISKILRRLSGENNTTVAINLCKKLEIAAKNQSNLIYIRRALDFLCETIIQILRKSPIECLNDVANVFGIFGYIAREDFPIYKNWLFKNYDNYKDIRVYLMRALKVTFHEDSNNRELYIYSSRLFLQLKNYLESSEQIDEFIAVSDCIAEFSNNYKKTFEKHFTDIVDIVVGWHLETDYQQIKIIVLKEHCSNVLQKFSEFFIRKLDFTLGLLRQFLEDISVFGDEIDNSMGAHPEITVGSFIGALNTVIKCLVNEHEIIAFKLGQQFFNDAVQIINRVGKLSLQKTTSIETVQSINEFYILIIEHGEILIQYNPNEIYEIIKIQESNLHKFDDNRICSLLYLILTLIKKLKTAISIDLVGFILGKITANSFGLLKFSKNRKIYKLYLKIYHEILIIKNVPLLQEAYKNILVDTRIATKILLYENIDGQQYTYKQAECVFNFYLSALSILATQTSSIIGMYALQPSLLELLLKDFEASNVKLWIINPVLHNSLIKFLMVHCKKNHNYILSSNLLTGNLFSKLTIDDVSPTSENFSYILKFHMEFLTNSIKFTEEIPTETFNIILSWLDSIFLQCGEYANIFKDNAIIQKICLALCDVSKTILTLKINLFIVNCLNTIIRNHQNLNIKIFDAIFKVCCIHMTSTNSEIRSKYTDIFSKLPLSITLLKENSTLNEILIGNSKINDYRQMLQPSTTFTIHMRDKYFKLFIDNITFQPETEFLNEIFINMFTKCWQPNKRKSIEIYQYTVNNLIMLIQWVQQESGQYCVNNKLRTALGKPQETFLKIEAIIKEYARILALKDYAKVKNVQTMIANQKHAKILLGFLEYLEKSIYNASDGTAFSMNAPEKPARIFFRVNISTCKEWFKRIRSAVNLIGLHCSEPEMVIRYSEDMLKSLIQENKINDPMYNHSLISFVLALIKTGESETLHGLYMLIKLRTGKRYAWIKCAAEQSSGHYEKAADGYANIMKFSTESMNFDKNVRDFVIDQLIKCLYLTRQWDQLKLYLDDNTNDIMLTLNSKQIDDIQQFENTLNPSVINLTNWEQFDNLSENLNNNFSYEKLLSLTENSLINLVIQPNVKYSDVNNLQIDHLKLIIQSGIQESFRTGATEYLNEFIILSNVIENITSTTKHQYNYTKIDKSNGFLALTKIKRWSDYFQSSNKYNQFINYYDDLHMNIISISRKQSNYKLCERELQDFFRRKEIGKLFNGDLQKISEYVQQNVNNLNTFNEYEIRGLCETSKWLFSQNENEESGIQLAACCTLKIINDISTKDLSGTIFPEKGSRMLLNLSDWVAQHPDTILSAHEETPLKKLIQNLPEIVDDLEHDITSVVPLTDMVVGKLIQTSVRQSQTLPKAWSALGNWYYRWGRKIIEAKTDINAGLSDKDIESIQSLISSANDDDLREIVEVLNKHQVIVDDEEIDTNEQSSTDLIEQQLRTIQSLQNISSDIITSVIGIWRQAHKSKSLFYEKAADAYFKYLNLATSDDDGDTENNKNYGECVTITATLRLLRLVVKHAFGLQDVLEDGLSTTPTRPWKAIIPQLFSRLNHHEQYVRKRVSELLCRVAKDSPHLIIFPAVVGAAQKSIGSELNDKDFNSSGGGDNNAPLILCFNSLLDTLYTQTPETVEQVQLLERELKRISLLWDEFWLHSLAQIYSEYSELFNSLENEIRKYSPEERINLVKAKHKILIDYVVNDLQRLQNITSRPPETNNEKLFQEKYSKLIETTISSLAEKPLNIEKPNESWQKIKQLYSVFQQKFQRNVQSSLKMSDISPILADLRNTSISMPGVETTESKPIYIRAVDNMVNILPTKTKPKKLAFYGSDGRKYTYLFKGLEDLHLDERIMQFLSISNSMMSKSKNGGAIYRAHYYSVIPLGPQSGLISWVDEMTPLFSLYKKWQQRESLHPQVKKDKPFTVMRPSEMFYKKLSPLLAEQNLKTTDNRKTWPLSILRKVLSELTQETPKDLLAKELWCHSNNATEWRESVRNYSRSVAVMSVIGYVIGLGDRHLDNVLVNLSIGNIVHIDYNVCFEKGKTLRVPERVPFRMTANLEEALGITGIEGIFRLTCEHVLKTLRKEREILLTLLEAFVYDPLVDWAVNDDGTAPMNSNNTNMSRTTKAIMAAVDISALSTAASELEPGTENAIIGDGDRRKSKKKLENEDMRTTLKTRFAEIKPEWTQYKNDLTTQLQLISESVNLFELKRRTILEKENERDYLSKQLSMVQEIDSLGTAMESHALNTVSQRYANYKKTLDEFNEVQRLLDIKLNEYKLQNLIYFNMLSINFIDIQNQLTLMSPNDNEFEYCKEFLENSAQTLLYQQADQLRKNMDKTIVQQLKITTIALDTMDKYLSVITLCPRSFLKRHRFIWYEEMCQILYDNPDKILQINQSLLQIQQQENIFIAESGERILQYAYALEKNWLEADFNLKKSYDLMKNSYPEVKPNILNDGEEALLTFAPSTTSPKIVLAALLSNLTGIINEFVIYEKNCQNSINDPYQYSPKLGEILEQQIIFLSGMIKSSKIVYTLAKQTSLQHMEAFNCLIQFVRSLITMESILCIEIVPRILNLIMLEDNEITKILQEIIQIQNLFSFGSILNNLNDNINCESTVISLKEMLTKIRSHNQFCEIFNIVDKIFSESLDNFITAIQPLQELEEKCSFKFMDHICVSKEIMSRTIHPIEILQQQFEIIKIQTIIQIISVAFQLTKSLIENDLHCVYDFNIFQQVISNSINLFETNFLLGYSSYLGGLFETELLSMLGLDPPAVKDTSNSEGLLFIAVQQNIAAGFFSVSNYSRAQKLCKQFLLTVKQHNLNENLKQCIQLETYALKHMQIIATVHFWINEKLLLQQPVFGHIIHKNIILQNFQGSLQSINGWQLSIEQIRGELISIGVAIGQRLKWAAGANQSLIGLQSTFEECHSKNNEKLKNFTEIVNNISRNITTILSYEMIKFNNQKSDEEFLLLAKEYHKCWEINIRAGEIINPVEKGIVQLLDPEGYIDHQWIGNITGLLDEITDGVQNKIANLEKEITQINDNLQNCAEKLRSLFDNELRIDIRYLLKLIFKIDNGHQVQRQKQFQLNYKQFLSHISDLHVKILSRDFTQDNCRDIQKLIDTILIEVNEIYEELMNLVVKGGNTHDNNEQNDGKSSGTPIRDKKKGNQPEQKRNAYAVSVWRRIRMKLEGRDPDPNRRQTIPEQVDWMIREATNPDNLAVLYEGWTPWV